MRVWVLAVLFAFIAAHAGAAESVPRHLRAQAKEAMHLYKEGQAAAQAGDYARAIASLEKSVSIREQVFGREHQFVAAVLYELGVLYQHIGAYEKALPLQQRVLAIRESTLGPDHIGVAAALNRLGFLYRELGAYEQAIPLMQRALAIREKAPGADRRTVAASLNNLSVIFGRTGDYESAIVTAERALAIQEQGLGPSHVQTTFNNVEITLTSLLSLAIALDHTNREAQALALLERALRIASLHGQPRDLARVYRFFSRLHARHGRMGLAILFGKLTVNQLQSIRQQLVDLSADVQQSFVDTNERDYQSLAGWLIREGRLPEAQQVLAMLKEAEFFDFLRSGGADDVRKTQASYTGEEVQLAARFQEVRGRLAAVGAELEALERKAKGGLSESERARRTALERDRDTGQQAFERFLGDLMKELGSTVTADRNREIGRRNLADVQALQETLSALGHGAVTLHYLVLEDRTHIILTTPQVQLVQESPVKSAELNRLIQRYREVLQDPRRDPLTLAQELYRILIGPVAQDLAQAKAGTLMISLDGALRYLPFAALHDGKQYLAESYALAIYTEASKDRLRQQPPQKWQFAGLGVTRAIESFSPLPAVRAELEGIIKGGILPGEVFFDEQFDNAQLRTTLDKRASVLHIASHFVFSPGTESNSFLLLGDGTRLSLAELKNYRFRDVDLITLSACETAIGGGRDENGREIEGFGALAQRQGANGVLATLWPVADDSTGEFMREFYGIRQTTPGMTKAGALRQAQMGFIRGGKSNKAYSHPFYWAPFILMGNWL